MTLEVTFEEICANFQNTATCVKIRAGGTFEKSVLLRLYVVNLELICSKLRSEPTFEHVRRTLFKFVMCCMHVDRSTIIGLFCRISSLL